MSRVDENRNFFDCAWSEKCSVNVTSRNECSDTSIPWFSIQSRQSIFHRQVQRRLFVKIEEWKSSVVPVWMNREKRIVSVFFLLMGPSKRNGNLHFLFWWNMQRNIIAPKTAATQSQVGMIKFNFNSTQEIYFWRSRQATRYKLTGARHKHAVESRSWVGNHLQYKNNLPCYL